MKRFAVFAGDNYYPCGGMNDFQKSFDTWGEALDFEKELMAKRDYTKPDWIQTFDMEEYE